MKLFKDVYRGRRVLLTGHTGFKGSWLALWLVALGAKVTGVSLPSTTTPNHWDLLGLDIADHRFDIRDSQALTRLIKETQPEVVFHLAAQSLVRRSYQDPIETWSTNVMGTANLLDACRQSASVEAMVVITTDKCYENQEWEWGYRETDRLGGHDPYSASKAAVELVAASFRSSFLESPDAPLLATGRAGNVIGGGDWSDDRLVPDLIRAVVLDKELEIRSPDATRPWQHVLEPLMGYLLLGQKLLERDRSYAEGWNFGPGPEGNCAVKEVLTRLSAFWPKLAWKVTHEPQPHEANMLSLDSTKARKRLNWQPVWPLNIALKMTAEWYRTFLDDGRVESQSQIERYFADARSSNLLWSLE